MKKALISVLAVGTVIASTTMHSSANQPLVTDQGEVILDLEQEPYQDLSTPVLDEPSEEIILDDPSEYVLENPEVKLDSEKVEPGNQEIILDDLNPSTNNKSVQPRTFSSPVASMASPASTSSGLLDKTSETFRVDSSGNIVVNATRNISSVSIEYDTGLLPQAYTVSGKKFTLNKDKLNNSAQGSYTFKITLDNGKNDLFTVSVVGDSHPDDYWSANITVYNMNPTSNRHVDLEMYSAATSLDIHKITANDAVVPSSKYRVINGTIVIDKSYLSSIGVNEFVRFNILYNKGQYADIILTVINEVVSGGVIAPEDC